MSIDVIDIARVDGSPCCYYVLARHTRADLSIFIEDFLIEVAATVVQPVRNGDGHVKLKSDGSFIDADDLELPIEDIETETVEVDVISKVKDAVVARFERAETAGESGNDANLEVPTLDHSDLAGTLAAIKAQIEGALI